MREVHRQLQFGQVPVDGLARLCRGTTFRRCMKGRSTSTRRPGGAVQASGEAHSSRDPPRGGASGDGDVADSVLGVLKQGLGCDFDRLHNLANHHETVRAMLGHSEFADKTHYELRRLSTTCR